MKVLQRPNSADLGCARFDLANGWTVSIASEIGKPDELGDIFVNVAWWPTVMEDPEVMQSKGMLTAEQAFARLLFVAQLDRAQG